jgi:hypothetical protein
MRSDSRCSSGGKISGCDADAPRPGQSYDRRSLAGSIQSAVLQSHSARVKAGAVGLSRMPIAQSARDDRTVDPIVVSDHVARSLVPGECLRDLSRDPIGGRICCDIDPDNSSMSEPDDDEGIEQAEPMVGTTNRSMAAMSGAWLCMKVRHPWLGGPRRLAMSFDARRRDLKPKLEQFSVNVWCSPKWILDAHPADQSVQLRADLRSPSPWARLPTPVAAKAGSVPTHEGLGPDDCENLQE